MSASQYGTCCGCGSGTGGAADTVTVCGGGGAETVTVCGAVENVGAGGDVDGAGGCPPSRPNANTATTAMNRTTAARPSSQSNGERPLIPGVGSAPAVGSGAVRHPWPSQYSVPGLPLGSGYQPGESGLVGAVFAFPEPSGDLTGRITGAGVVGAAGIDAAVPEACAARARAKSLQLANRSFGSFASPAASTGSSAASSGRLSARVGGSVLR